MRYAAPVAIVASMSVAFAAAAETARVAVTASESEDGASVTLRRDGEAALPKATAQVAGGVLIVRFAAPVEADVSALPSAAPRTIAAARRDSDGRALRISLRRTLRAEIAQDESSAAVTLTPTTSAAAADPAPASSAPPPGATATVSVGVRPDLTRLSFLFQGGASVTQTRRGDRLELRFSRPAEIDLASLRARPPQLVRAVEKISPGGQRLALALTLEPGVRVRQFAEGSRVVIDLAPPEGGVAPSPPPPPPPPPPPKANDPAPRSGVVPVTVEEGAEETRLTFAWGGPARAALFRRGDAIWIAFDTTGRFDIRGARRTEIAPVRGEGVAALRLSSGADDRISARVQGNAWIVTVGPQAGRLDAAPLRRDVGAGGRGRMVVDFGRDGVVRRLTDPVAGDAIDVALIPGPPRGVEGRRATTEAAVLAAYHGTAVERRSDSIGAAFENGALVVAAGLNERPASEDEYVEPLEAIAFLDVRRDAAVPAERVLDRKYELERRAAAEGMGEGDRVLARMALARFLVAHELSAEALGALKVASINQPQLDLDPEYRLARAAANVMLGRTRDAKGDLEATTLADDPAAALWRGWCAASERDWESARRELERGRRAIPAQPKGWQAKFELALARAALELQDLDAAAAAVARTLALAPTPEISGDARIIEAKIAEARGDPRAALSAIQALKVAPTEIVAVRATFEAARIARALGGADDATTQELEALALRWRGDTLEIEIVQQLAAYYAEKGRWRDALVALRGAANKHRENPLGRTLRADMSDIFERLFLDGAADGMPPVQALGLFYDFKELTPIGANGDRMVRNLAGRLVALDLLEQAAVLLQHQVEERLEGVGRAQIAADLAVIYLQDRKPDKALAAIELSRQPNMPTAVLGERRILEAKAYLDLGRTEQAVEMLERDRSPEAQRIRAEAAWRDRDWPRAAAELRQTLSVRARNAPLSDDERNIVLRTAIALTFSENSAGVAALRREYAVLMAGSPDADAFEVVTASVSPGDVKLRELARAVGRTDLLERFLRSLKTRMAAPQPAQAAAPAAGPPRA